jgi:glycosyltransferase involved in cell wall biosynthesis
MSEGREEHELRSGYEIIRPRSIIRKSLHEVSERGRVFSRASDTNHLRQGSHDLAKLFALASSFFLTQLTLLRTARRLHAQIYCANDIDTLLVTIIAAGLDRPIVYDSHELWPDMMLVPESVKALVRSMERVLIRRATAVMTVNEFIADELTSRYSITRRPTIVYNCPKADPPKIRRKRRSDLKVALYQGMYSPDRGLENLIKAADYLLPDIRLVLRGYGVIEKELKSVSVGRKNVQFANPVKMSALVSAATEADVGIIPNLPTNLNNYLASPNKLFEYIQAGIPIVACDIPFLRKVIVENDIGMVFDYRDPRSLGNALNRATRNDTLRRQRANVASVAKRFSWDIESRKLLNFYENICSPTRLD